jgi:hypothetical protein
MLSFLATLTGGPSPSATSCDAWQAIDVSAFSSLITSGQAKFNASAYFNRVPGDALSDTLFSVEVRAYSGDVSNFPAAINSPLERAIADMVSDADVNTWELAQSSLVLPANTSYVAIFVRATENVFNEPDRSTEFDGHYSDLVSASISAVPEPDSLAFFVMCTLVLWAGWGGGRRRLARPMESSATHGLCPCRPTDTDLQRTLCAPRSTAFSL